MFGKDQWYTMTGSTKKEDSNLTEESITETIEFLEAISPAPPKIFYANTFQSKKFAEEVNFALSSCATLELNEELEDDEIIIYYEKKFSRLTYAVWKKWINSLSFVERNLENSYTYCNFKEVLENL